MQNLYQLTLMNNSDSQRLSGADSYKKMFHVKHHGGDCCAILYIMLCQFCDKCVSDSLAQTTLKSQRLSGANSYIKFYAKHYDGITYCNNI